MGRQIIIHRLDIYCRDNNKRIHISKKYIERISKKYDTDPPPLKFDKEGALLYDGKYQDVIVFNDIEKLVIIILRVARRYKIKITGSFVYTDDQTGGSYSGIVFFLEDDSAIINQFNTDKYYNTTNFQTAQEQTIITLVRKKSTKNLDDLKVSELKAMAKEKSIKGYSKMKKDELLKALK